jgi:hypothetical protein
MAVLGRRLNNAPFWIRWPIKWLIFGTVVFFVCYPYPSLLRRHIQHSREIDKLPDPTEPLLQPLLADLDTRLDAKGLTTASPREWLREVQLFVSQRIPYSFDWDNWGVVDYLPTLAEVIQRGTEDCDGRAVLAAALIRARLGSAELVGNPSHLWVSTPIGETMGPMGKAVMRSSSEGLHVQWTGFINVGHWAVGVALFPIPREAIIILTAWLLLLPAGFSKRQVLLSAFLIIEAWIIMRLAGRNPYEPNYWAARWAIVHVLAAVVILSLPPRFFRKNTVRSVP